MPVYASLLSNIPLPQQNWHTKTNVPAVASIKVGDIETDNSQAVKNYSDNLFDRIKNYFVAKRLEKLEKIPPEQRTANQQAEISANKQSLNCMV